MGDESKEPLPPSSLTKGSEMQQISAIAGSLRTGTKSGGEMIRLPLEFRPGPFDVICRRGKIAYSHSGNRRFRILVSMHLEEYAKVRRDR